MNGQSRGDEKTTEDGARHKATPRTTINDRFNSTNGLVASLALAIAFTTRIFEMLHPHSRFPINHVSQSHFVLISRLSRWALRMQVIVERTNVPTTERY